LAGEVIAGFLAQGVQREQAGQFGDGYGHGAWSGEVCPESIATFRLAVGLGPTCLPPGQKQKGPRLGALPRFGWGTRIRRAGIRAVAESAPYEAHLTSVGTLWARVNDAWASALAPPRVYGPAIRL